MAINCSKKDDEHVGNKKKDEGNEYLFELATFLAVSASGCMDEPPSYGSLRLIEALSKLIDLPKHVSCLSEDKFLKGIKNDIDEKSSLILSNMEEFNGFIDELVSRFVIELKERQKRLS